MCNTEKTGLNEYNLIFSEGICDISKLNRESKIKKLFSSIYNKVFARNKIKPSAIESFYSKIDLAVYYMRDNLKIGVIKNDISKVKASIEYARGNFDSNIQDGSLVSIMAFMIAVLAIAVDIYQSIFVIDTIKDKSYYLANINYNIKVLEYLVLIIIFTSFIVLISKKDTKKYKEQIMYYTYLESELQNLICDFERECHNNEREDTTISNK